MLDPLELIESEAHMSLVIGHFIAQAVFGRLISPEPYLLLRMSTSIAR